MTSNWPNNTKKKPRKESCFRVNAKFSPFHNFSWRFLTVQANHESMRTACSQKYPALLENPRTFEKKDKIKQII